MLKQVKLKDVPFGNNFKAWGHEYTVLDSDDKGIFVLETPVVCEMPFREYEVEYKVAPNDFLDSSVRAYLEGIYTEKLVRAGAKLSEDILPMELDLKCTLGQHEYGTAKVYAGLLTLEQYGKYYGIIPKIDTPYWLATPWKTPSHSPNSYGTSLVWGVYSNGYCNYWYYGDTYGVRPALTLSPSLLVSVECDDKECGEDSFCIDETCRPFECAAWLKKALKNSQAENEKLKAERNAVIEQLRGYCHACKNYTPNHNEGPCEGCKHEYFQYRNADARDNWEWCGVKVGQSDGLD